jgi:hypothetical protein
MHNLNERIISYIFLVALISNLYGCSKNNDALYKCKGTSKEFVTAEVFKESAEIETSIYIGKDFVERSGKKYKVCEKTKTTIRYADDCKKRLIDGTFDIALNSINEVDHIGYPTISAFNAKCELISTD